MCRFILSQKVVRFMKLGGGSVIAVNVDPFLRFMDPLSVSCPETERPTHAPMSTGMGLLLTIRDLLLCFLW